MRRSVILISAVFLLLSCSKTGTDTIVSGTFDAALNAVLPEMHLIDNPDAGDTKAATQYTVRIKWAEGDKLSVINMTRGTILGGTLSATTTGVSIPFSGTLKGVVNKGDNIAYFYPAQNNTEEIPFSGINVDMSAQAGTMAGVPLCAYSATTADDDSFANKTISFSYLMGYIMIGLSDIPSSTQIKSVTLTNMTNKFDLSINSSKTGFDITKHTGDIVLTPSQTASAAGVKTVYAAIPATTGTTRYAILETSTTNFTTSFTSATLNNAYAYNTNVSGFLVDDLIPVDENVRNFCLDHFDSNGDGKLSMVEVAGVKSFPDASVSPLPSDIKRFNELEFFYGLTSLPVFKNQKKLESITIPKQITAIPNDMFYGCSTLTKVTLKPSVPPTLGSNAFYGLSGSVILVVADKDVATYQAADGWKDYFNNFRTESSQNDSTVDIDTEDEDTMGNDRIDIVIN